MYLEHGVHLGYCTNVHRGETWTETLKALESHTLRVRASLCSDRPYGIGLRLSNEASRELSRPDTLAAFQRWLLDHGCYVFTINGFPYGSFHGTRVKENVYTPDWTSRERLSYTLRLFDILAALVPDGVEGSVSTVPGSFKESIRSAAQVSDIQQNLWRCVDYLAVLQVKTGKTLHLGLEPEPLCYLETTEETVGFFDRMRSLRPGDDRIDQYLGVTYDACHLAVEFEDARTGLALLRRQGIRLSKLHFSAALRLRATPSALARLQKFDDPVYLHQVVVRRPDGQLSRYKDLDVALATATHSDPTEEWRVHFHVPLHTPLGDEFGTTATHLEQVMDILGQDPTACHHIEIETYTWEVLPTELRRGDVVDQIVGEYRWTLERLGSRGLLPLGG